jgi:hypothetical protein
MIILIGKVTTECLIGDEPEPGITPDNERLLSALVLNGEPLVVMRLNQDKEVTLELFGALQSMRPVRTVARARMGASPSWAGISTPRE